MIQCCSNRCPDKVESFVTELNSSLLWRPETVCFRREFLLLIYSWRCRLLCNWFMNFHSDRCISIRIPISPSLNRCRLPLNVPTEACESLLHETANFRGGFIAKRFLKIATQRVYSVILYHNPSAHLNVLKDCNNLVVNSL